MALAFTQQATETAPVIRATLRHYPPGMTQIVQWEVPEGTCPLVEVAAHERVEVIVPSDIPLASLRTGIAELAATKDVWVIVAADRMGAAHRALRGTSVVLQPWWLDGRIHFGRPERS